MLEQAKAILRKLLDRLLPRRRLRKAEERRALAEAARHVDKVTADANAFVAEVRCRRERGLREKALEGTLTLEDFLGQLQQVKKMGDLQEVVSLMPGMGGVDFSSATDEIPRIEAIIRSMTLPERRDADLIDGPRCRRIAAGSGTTAQEVSSLLRQFRKMKKMMREFRQPPNA